MLSEEHWRSLAKLSGYKQKAKPRRTFLGASLESQSSSRDSKSLRASVSKTALTSHMLRKLQAQEVLQITDFKAYLLQRTADWKRTAKNMPGQQFLDGGTGSSNNKESLEGQADFFFSLQT